MIKKMALIIPFFLFICVAPLNLLANELNPQSYAVQSRFSLSTTSKNLPASTPNDSKIKAQNAFAIKTNEFFGGKTNALKILFFAEPLTQEALSDLKGDGREWEHKYDAALVLFIDKDNKIWQANLTYVIPGYTSARTVAWQPEDLKQFFSDYTFDGERLTLRSNGAYKDPAAQQERDDLSWDINLDIPVLDKTVSK